MRFLKGIIIQNTTRCNARCTVCPHSTIYNDLYDMSEETWDRLLFCLKSMNYNAYVGFLMQCEPLMDKQIFSRIKDLNNLCQNIQVGLFTNASLLTPNVCEKLKSLKISHITMSMLSANREEYEKITGLNFDIVTENIIKGLFLFNKSETYAVINASLGSLLEKEAYTRVFPDCMDRIKFNLRDSRGGFFDNIKSNYENWCLECVNKSQTACDQPTHYLPIFADGSVRFCSSDWKGESCIGNIKYYTIEEIFYGKEMKSAAERLEAENFDYEFCSKCYKEIGLGKCAS